MTPAQLLQLRTKPNAANLWLSIYRPKTLLAAQVTGSPVRGETDISFDTVSAGSYLNCYANITVKIGTTAGASDIGTIRMRSITSSAVVFAENSIVWQDNYFLTFIDYIDVNPVFPRIIKDPNQADNVIFYKDDDIPYSNQNTIFGTFPCAGPHRAGFLVTGSCGFFYSSTGSYNVKGDSLTFNWAFEGGTPTGSTLRDPGLVQRTTYGHFRDRLIITSSSGAQDVTYRYASVYQRPEEGVNTPVLQWEIGDLSGSRQEGGYTVHLKSWNNLSDIEPNALVVIFQENWYGGTKVSLGGNSIGNSSILFVGYILKDSITFNYSDGYAEYDVGSITLLMKETEGFSVSCESVVTPDTWFELDNMTVAKAIYHYLRWHSTVLNVADFQYTGDDRLVEYFDSDRESLYDAIDTFVRQGLIGEVVADRQGKIWTEITPPGYVNPMASIPAGMTIQKQDWMGEPNITERRTAELSFVEMGGIVYQGPVTDQFFAILSNAPTFTPLYRGKSEKPYEGMILLSQEQLNQIAGNYLEDKNSPLPVVSMSLNGTYTNLDIAPQEKIFLDINASDTRVGKSLIGLPYRLTSMSWRYNATQGILTPEVEFNQMVTGTAGQTLIIPIDPPDTWGWTPPDFEFDLPPGYDFEVPPAQEQISRQVLLFDETFGFVYTLDFDAVSPTWAINNAGINAVDLAANPDLFTFFIAPNGSVWIAYHEPNNAAIYYAPSLDSIYTKLIDDAFLQAEYPTSADWNVQSLGFNPEEPEEIAFIAGGTTGLDTHQGNFWIGNRNGFTKKVSCPNLNIGFDSTRGNLTYNTETDKWVATGQIESGIFDPPGIVRFNGDGSSLELVKSYAILPTQPFPSVRARDSGWLFIFNADGGAAIVTTNDDGTTEQYIAADLSLDPFYPFNNLACDPTGRFLMATWTAAAQKGKSSDYATTFVALANLPPGGAYVFAYCGGVGLSSQWIAARGVIRYSPDFGTTWINKEGNAPQILLPAPDIRGIAVNIGRRTV